MEKPKFQSKELIDYLFSFEAGVDAGIAPILLQKNQLAYGSNTTVRRSFVHPRPPVKKLNLTFDTYQTIQSDFEDGRFQGCCVFNPDNGVDSLMAQISGHLFRIEIVGNTATVFDVSIPGDLNDPNRDRCWMIQAEKWIIVTDGLDVPPIFYNPEPKAPDTLITRRSNSTTSITFKSTLSSAVIVPNVGATVVGGITLDDPFTGSDGDVININPVGGFTVLTGAGTNNLTASNYNAQPVGATAAAKNQVTWTAKGNELPPGREIVYGLGRVWMALIDGKQYLGGDLVGGASGHIGYNFRDSVLNATENTYILGGGTFTIPGSYGEIRALCFMETIDSSLGQGALQIFTDTTVFSNNAPVDRTTWQTLQNPILTESAKGGGGLSHWSTFNVNADIMSRARDGIRSLKLTRSEFSTWGTTPISREVQPQIDRDSEDLLRFVSGCVFDNRALMLSEGVLNPDRGVYFTRMIPINLDPNSSLRGKAPSVYDGLFWQGLNVFRIVTGVFSNTQRCFMFTLNNFTGKIELWELLPEATTEIYDDVSDRIVWSFETFLDFGQKDPRTRFRLRLDEAEIYVDELRGKVDFQTYYRPDDWPCWVPWHAWQECEQAVTDDTKPGFRPNMGLGEPSPDPCDPTNNRPLREGYTFHFKMVITGHCRVKGGRFGAITVPQPEWAPPICDPICAEGDPTLEAVTV